MSIEALLEPIRNRIRMMFARCIVSLINDSTNMQIVQIKVGKNEVQDDIERVQDYGFTSVPRPGSEALMGFLNGNRDHGIAIKIDDSRVRIKDLESGEVAVYNYTGVKILMKDDATIHAGKATTPLSGVVTGECIDSFTGAPHADKSSVVFAQKVPT